MLNIINNLRPFIEDCYRIIIDLSRIYWRLKLNKFVEFLTKNLTNPTIILFGSLSKAETKNDSDIDICVIGHKKEFNIKSFENLLKRKIQLFFFGSIQDIKNKELAMNIINGYLLEGRLKL